MAITTTNITGDIALPDGTIPSQSSVTFTMTGFDTDATADATIAPRSVTSVLSDAGALDVDLWSNEDGERTTFYDVRLNIYNGTNPKVFDVGKIEVPTSGGPYDLNDLLPIAPPSGATVDEYIAQLAASVASAEAAADSAEGDAAAAAVSAAEAALYDGVWLDDVADLLANTALTYTASQPGTVAAGDIVQTRAECFSYEVAASGATDEHLETAGGVKLYLQRSQDGSYPFGAMDPSGDGVANDTAKLQTITDFVASLGGGRITIPAGDFRIEGLNVKSGVSYVGVGYERNVADSGLTLGGTRFTRTSALRMINVIGTGSRTASHEPISNVYFFGIMFDGGEYVSDLFATHAVVTSKFENCMFTKCEGARWFDMREVWDTQFFSCRFEQGGDSTGSVPGIEMISGGVWERTNQIHFHSCVWENFPGHALAGTSNESGYYTNEIYFFGCKVETSQDTEIPLVLIRDMRSVHFEVLNLSAKGLSGTSIDAPLRIYNSEGVYGVVSCEFISGGADWGAYVAVGSSKDVSLTARVYGAYSPTTGYVFDTDGSNANSMSFHCLGADFYDAVADTPSRIGDSVLIERKAGEPQLQMKRSDVSDSWSLGRLTADGAGTKFRVLHGSTTVLSMQNDNKSVFSFPVKAFAFENETHTVAELNSGLTGQTTGWSSYCTDETGGAVPVFYDGTNWRRSTDRAIIS